MDQNSSSNCVSIQCNTTRQSYFKKSTGSLVEFSSTNEVELRYSNKRSKVPLLTFHQSTQVTHEKEELISNTVTTSNSIEKQSNIKTYSKKEPFVEAKKSPLVSPSTSQVSILTGVCFQGYQTVSDTGYLHALTAVEKADFELLLVCLDNFCPQKRKVEDLLLMFLMKIRHDLPFTALAALFGIDNTLISKYFYLILDHLSVQ